MAGFTDFLRHPLYKETTEYKVDTHTFQNGSVQKIDKWGRNKKIFELNFKTNTKAEALEIRDWFVDKEGSLDTFVFTEPLEDVPYDVQFKEDAFKIQRIGQDAFNITVVLEEQF